MRFLPWTSAWCLLAAVASGGENLVRDASFESPLPAWFAERSGTSYHARQKRGHSTFLARADVRPVKAS
jgi:hypothetical protein